MKNAQKFEASWSSQSHTAELRYTEFVLSIFSCHVLLSAMAEDKTTFLINASMASIIIQLNPLNHSGNYMYRLL
jgi:hypothetical protein